MLDIDLQTWLEDLASRPLPGGVAAAAMAAAMGAALIVKAGRVTLRRQAMAEGDQAPILDVVELADGIRVALPRLAGEDARAYRAYLASGGTTATNGRVADVAAWAAATETPLRIAETCQRLLGRLPVLGGSCWPGVCADFEIARWLLEAGLRAGLLAAETNLPAGGESARAQEFQSRLADLKRLAPVQPGEEVGP